MNKTLRLSLEIMMKPITRNNLSRHFIQTDSNTGDGGNGVSSGTEGSPSDANDEENQTIKKTKKSIKQGALLKYCQCHALSPQITVYILEHSNVIILTSTSFW